MESDETEKPVRQALFRQSSLETRLYPEQDTGSSGESDGEPQLRENPEPLTKPRVVSMVAKSPRAADVPPAAPRRVSSLGVTTRPMEHTPLRVRADGILDLREDEEGYSKITSTPAEYMLMTNTHKTPAAGDTPADPAPKDAPAVEDLYSVPHKNRLEDTRDSITQAKSKQAAAVDSTLVLARPDVQIVTSEATKDRLIQPDTESSDKSTMGEATLRRVRFQDEKSSTTEVNKSTTSVHTDKEYEEIVVEPAAAANDEAEYAEVEQGQQASLGTLKVTSLVNMASPRPKSPRPGNVSARGEKEESFWEKIGTLGRKKRIKEVQEVQDEGKYAIDSPGNPLAPDLPPEEYALEENEERSMISPQSYENPRLRELMAVLIEWINDELASQRIIVKDLEEDLYDGQVLQKLIETLTEERLDVPEVTQSEEGQRQKLGIVLATANRVLGLPRWSQQKWSVESIHSKNVITILHLLVALARHFRAPVRLPERVAVQVVVVQMHNGVLSHRTVTEEITSTYDDLGMRGERDAFDTLFDHAPDKLQVVKKSLVTFVNKHLNKLGLEVTDLDTQFHDGVFLVLLMGLLEGFFVPLYAFHNTPHDFDQKVHNVSLAFDLMQEVGLARPKARPEDIVNLDLKSTLRVLYNLFTKYKGMS